MSNHTKSFLFLPIFLGILLGGGADLSSQEPTAAGAEMVPIHVSATTENAGFDAPQAFDGNPHTFWHSQFSAPATPMDSVFPFNCPYGYACGIDHPKPADPDSAPMNSPPHPHDLLIDLGNTYTLTGFTYTPRQDMSNGRIAEYEFYLTASPNDVCSPVAKGSFSDGAAPQRLFFANGPKTGRYVRFRSLREVNGHLFTSVAELELLADGYRFIAETPGRNPGLPRVAIAEAQEWFDEIFPPALSENSDANSTETVRRVYADDLIHQYNVLCEDFGQRSYFHAIVPETANPESLILATDRDPLDVLLRRVQSLADELDAAEISTLSDGSSLAEVKSQLASLGESAKTIDPHDVKERFGCFVLVAALRRVMLFSHRELDFDKILFVKKDRSEFNHICDQYYGRSAVSGGGLFVLERPFAPTYAPEAKNLLEDARVQTGSRQGGEKLDGGSFVTPELSFDAEKIAFAWCACTGSAEHIDHLDLSRGHTEPGRCYHLFTCNADGSNLTRITDGMWNDFDPCFLPNGRMAFTSERRGGYLRCGRDCPNYTLFDMNPDGTQMRCLSYHETNEWNPSVTNDGKIVWTRWDYIDRFGCVAHHPWITTPDGRDPRAVHGNFSRRHKRPDAELDVRAVPNSPKFIATGAPHHGQCYGSLVLIDPQVEDDDAMSPLKRLTPNVGFPESQGGHQVWGNPWPLSESLFLATADYSMRSGGGFQGEMATRGDYGIYLADSAGNIELVYRDPESGVASPIPMTPRPTPPIVPSLVPLEEIEHQPFVTPPADFHAPRPEATITISNVYDSLKPWPEGTKITDLRVVQVYCMSVPSGYPPHDIGYREKSSLDSVNLARGVLGTVPVDADGSVHFTVPAYTEIFFQALDANGAAVQSMRSGTSLKPGETLSCTGCHEPKHQSPAASTTLPTAFSRLPSRLRPEPDGANPLSYPELVQPIWDRHCVACHDLPDSRAQNAPNLGREPAERKFYASYNHLVGGGWAFYDYGDSLRTTPGRFGAIHSKLYALLKNGHYDVALSDEEMRAVVVWLDLLSNFYGVYEKEGGERQFRGEKAFPTLE